MVRVWHPEEVTVLLDFVEVNYAFLTDALTNRNTRRDVEAKWAEVLVSINALGMDQQLVLDQVKRKWFDLKSRQKVRSPPIKWPKSKQAVAQMR